MAEEKTTKPAVKAEKKTATAAKKPAAKKAAPAKKTAAKKPAATTAKKAPAKKAAVVLSPLEELTTLVWKKIEKKNVKDIPPIAVQVDVHDVGTFYVAVNVSGNPEEDKQVIPAEYNLASGYLTASADEIKKIAAGKYDYIAAVKSGTITYNGNLGKGVILAELFK